MTLKLADILQEQLGPDAPRRVGVAVSGGGDSMALLAGLIAAGFRPEVATVNHGLRPEAAQEAGFVAQFCRVQGVPHTTLEWQCGAGSGNLMQAARLARLQLMGGWARQQALGLMLLGHTADDEAETFLMRLGRKAGLEGLSGMRPRFEAAGVLWQRPLLGVTRRALRGWLAARGIAWVEDPSNENPAYERVRARQALAGLAPLGLGAAELASVVGHLAAADATLAMVLAQWWACHGREDRGDLIVPMDAFRQLQAELQRRLLNAALIWLSGQDYGPRASKLAAWLLHPRTATLHGCRLTLAGGYLRLSREARAVAGPCRAEGGLWDRWLLRGPCHAGLHIGPLGSAGLKQLENWRAAGLPRASLLASPALWQGENLLAAPLAGLENGWKAQIARGAFADMLIRR